MRKHSMLATPIHEQELRRFILPVADSEAVLEYRYINEGHIDFYRTFVPPEGRGSGAAQKLVRAGLRWAKSESLQINASCWYVEKFLR